MTLKITPARQALLDALGGNGRLTRERRKGKWKWWLSVPDTRITGVSAAVVQPLVDAGRIVRSDRRMSVANSENITETYILAPAVAPAAE